MGELKWWEKLINWAKERFCWHDFTDWDFWEEFKIRMCKKCSKEEMESLNENKK